MSRKPKYIPPPHATKTGSNSVFTGLYANQVQSEAFRELTAKQQMLFIQMRFQEFSKDRPPSEYGQHTFYFPKSMWNGVLKLYDHDERFYRDVDALISVGLIDCVKSGYTVKQPNIYRFSERWKCYGTDKFDTPPSVCRMKVRG